MLLSGGASALMAVPADGLTLDDKRATTERLLRAGADIHALNTVRKHLSAIKGGWLAAARRGACRDARDLRRRRRRSRASSASGPDRAGRQHVSTTRSTSCGGSAATARYPRGGRRAPRRRRRGDVRRDAEAGRSRGSRDARRRSSAAGATRWTARVAEARARGYHVMRIDDAGRRRSADAAAVASARGAGARGRTSRRPACIVSSGETTVRVTGRRQRRPQPGIRARAPRTLLAAARRAAVAGQRRHRRHRRPDRRRRRDRRFDHASPRARRGRLAAGASLADNDAYAFFDALGDLIHTGPTGTNVGDLQSNSVSLNSRCFHATKCSR